MASKLCSYLERAQQAHLWQRRRMDKAANPSIYIKAWREYRGLNQTKLAKLSGYETHSAIKKAESGLTNPSIPQLQRIAGALGIELFQLFLPPPSTVDDHLRISLHSLTSDQKATLLGYIEGLTERSTSSDAQYKRKRRIAVG